ncbi:MAG: serine hydrolase domain-containing protein [Rhodoferax sp.]|uniref:serine hydrolase domain-containing protein n=1 Tax=Rhodoferax sp. TaxID=50421 RepID=UPI003262F5E4
MAAPINPHVIDMLQYETPSLPRFARCVLLTALMALASCASTPNPEPASAEPADQLVQLVERHNICAAAVAVIRQRTLHQVMTASGCDPALDVRADSVFQAASLSKPVFAYAVLKLVEQGRLALDAPVLRYLPHGYRHAFDPLQEGASASADEVTDPRLQAVTVRMLLQHTAGLPNWASGPLHFKSTPGTRWTYSGEGYVLLQRAVEAVVGQPLDEVMQEQVFAPLGMAHSSYRLTPEIAERLLSGTKANGAPRKVIELRRPVAAFSLYTTAEDYGRFLAALLRDEALLARISDSPVDVDTGLNLRWGLGWGIEHTGDDVHLWQWGNNPGYRAFAIAFPRSGDGLVMLTNSDGGLKLAEPLVRAALPAQHEVFRSSFVTSGVMDVLCEVLRVCL